MSDSHNLEWYEEFAKAHGYRLTKIAEKVIKSVEKCNGYCPCRYNLYLHDGKTHEELDKIKCPCIYIEEDMAECSGKVKTCHCHLFEKTEE